MFGKKTRDGVRDLLDATEILSTVKQQTAAIEALSKENEEISREIGELKRELDRGLSRIEERVATLREVMEERMNTHKEAVIGTAERVSGERVASFVDRANNRFHTLALDVDRISRHIQSSNGKIGQSQNEDYKPPLHELES